MYNDDPLNTLAHALSDHEQRCLALGLDSRHAQVVMFVQCWTQRPRDGQGLDPVKGLAHADCQSSRVPTCTHWQVHTVVITGADAARGIWRQCVFRRATGLPHRVAQPPLLLGCGRSMYGAS